MRVVGGDLQHQLVRLAPGLGVADLFLGRAGGDRRAHRFGIEHRIDHGAPMRQIRPDHRGADAVEMGAQHPRDLAREALRADLAGFVQHAAQRHRRGEVHHGVAAVQQQRQQAAEAADHHPVLREQHAEPAAVATWRATDIDRYRHDLDVVLGHAFQRMHQLAQGSVRRALAVASRRSSRRVASAQIPSAAGGCRPAAASGWAGRPRGRRAAGSARRRNRRARSRSRPARRPAATPPARPGRAGCAPTAAATARPG